PRHGQHGAALGAAQRAIERLPEQRLAVAHAHERLGIGAARDRPEPGAGAAGKDHGYEHGRSLLRRRNVARWTVAPGNAGRQRASDTESRWNPCFAGRTKTWVSGARARPAPGRGPCANRAIVAR